MSYTLPRPSVSPHTRKPKLFPPSSYWLFAWFFVQVICQLGLLFEILAPLRVVFRSASFGFNLLALFLAFGPKKNPHHPSFWVGIFILIWIAAQIINPTTNTAVSAVATLALMASIIAPLYWVPRLEITLAAMRTVFLLMWGFHGLSALFGVAQVYYPGEFQPAVSQAVKEATYGGDHLKVMLGGGDIIYRPMGLTDVPGGASNAGLWTFVFGMGLFALSRNIVLIIAGLLSMPLGFFCIYLCQIRSNLVLAVVISMAFAVLLAVTQRLGSAIRVSFVVPAVLVVGFIWAVALGGAATADRFETLVEDNPEAIYAKNRGKFLAETFEELIQEYPFGAGLGRYGMILTYFGDRTLEGSYPLWAEIQWTAWLYDGGILLMFAYPLAMLIATWVTARVAFDSRAGPLAGWAMLILAYDVSIFMLTFSYIPFVGNVGMEFWMLNAMVFAVHNQMKSRPAWRSG